MKEPTVEQLAATLAAHDLPLLRTEQAVPPLPLDPPSLIAALARHPDGRLGEALISGRLYLVGGTSLLLVAAKTATLDMGLQYEVDPSDHTEFVHCIRQVSRQMAIPVERASPSHFIPLPAGYAERHQFIGRYGQLDVFHFDFYSVALSKLHRGNEKDFTDVIAMVQRDLVSLPQLKQYFAEVLAQLEIRDIGARPEAFARKFALFEQRLGATA